MVLHAVSFERNMSLRDGKVDPCDEFAVVIEDLVLADETFEVADDGFQPDFESTLSGAALQPGVDEKFLDRLCAVLTRPVQACVVTFTMGTCRGDGSNNAIEFSA